MPLLRSRLVVTVSAALSAALLLAQPASARDFGAGPSPISYEPGERFAIEPEERILIEGFYSGGGASRIIVRIEDEWASSAETRYEGQFAISPGSFTLEIPASALVAADADPIDLEEVVRLVLFSWDDANTVFSRVEAVSGPRSDAASAEAAGDDAAMLDLMRVRPLPIVFEPAAPIDLTAAGAILVEGVYAGEDDAVLYLHVEDQASPTDGDRFNGEFAVSPGAFQIVTPVSELETPAGRPLDLSGIRRIALSADENSNFEILRLEMTAADATAAAERLEGPARDRAEREAVEPLDLGSGRAPLARDFFRATDLSAYDEIIIEGVVRGDESVGVVLRIDDSQSDGYASRFNLERELPPGPFRLRAALGGLRAHDGRLINPADVRLVHFWLFTDEVSVEVSRFEARQAPILPNDAVGYAFGHPAAALPPGFERIGPGDARVSSGAYAVARPLPDPLVANGLRRVGSVELPEIPPGRYRVTVWSEDPGEWEYLPHPLRRRIVVNGVDLRNDQTTPVGWLEERYMRGFADEHTPEDDAYSAYGAHRGEPYSADVVVGEDGLRLELSGDGGAARYISAMVIAAEGDESAEAAVEASRADWYRDYWPVDPTWRADSAADAPFAFRARLTEDGAAALTAPDGADVDGASLRIAPGTGARLTIEAIGDGFETDATATLTAPVYGDTEIDGVLWSGQWRLERRRPQDTLLSLTDNTLLSTGSTSIPSDRPRRFEIWFEAPADVRPGHYVGALEIATDAGVVRMPIDLHVLDVTLPEASEPAGFYLFESAHLGWFASDPINRQRQAACDVEWLARFDLRGSAPAVGTPRVGNTVATTVDLRRAYDLGLTPPWLAYNPIRPMQFDLEPEQGAALIAEVERELRAAGAATPAWSVADELSNPGSTAVQQFWPWVEALRAAAPDILLAGHINNPADSAYLDAFDVVLLNNGYGIEPEILTELSERGLDVWLYNTWTPRVTAGFWLWATDAERYVQWHARLPTADPFDPIDGREGDVQAILPSLEICPEQPAIHRNFLRLAEGVVDQRWLLWLDAQPGDEAEALRRRLRERAADGWSAAAEAGDVEMARIRAEIMALAD